MYTVILDHLIKVKNSIHGNKIEEAKSYICDMFLYLCDAKRYIDTAIYDNAIKFKDYFFSRITKTRQGR